MEFNVLVPSDEGRSGSAGEAEVVAADDAIVPVSAPLLPSSHGFGGDGIVQRLFLCTDDVDAAAACQLESYVLC